MRNKIIFLDIDGVLNTFDEPEKETWEEEHTFNQESLQLLKSLVELTGAKIVISSTWRLHGKRKDRLWYKMEEQLNEVGLEIYDVTPPSFDFDEPVFIEGYGWCKWSMRGHEIEKWLNNNPLVESFVILDDDTDMVHLMPHLVQTCTIHGFQPEHYEKALKMLTK